MNGKGNADQLMHEFKLIKGPINFYTSNNEQLNFIDIRNNRIEYTTTVASTQCNCCTEIESHIAELDEIFDWIGEEEFDEFRTYISKTFL